MMKMVFGHAARGVAQSLLFRSRVWQFYRRGGLDMLLVGMVALGIASFAAMLAFVGFCDWV